MRRIKLAAFAAISVVGLTCLPSTPASAGGLLFVPWALGHLLTLPLVIASAAVSAATAGYDGAPYAAAAPYYGPSYYPQAPAYSAAPAYPAPPAYYGQSYAPSYAPSVPYYAPAPAYYGARGYYGAAVGYARPYARYYAPRYDAAPRLRYPGTHGAQGWYGSPGYYHRHR